MGVKLSKKKKGKKGKNRGRDEGEAKREVRKARRFVKIQLDSTWYHCDERYQLKNTLGNGAYGHVASALDTFTNKKVAIKRVDRLLDDETDAKRILREVKILRHLSKHGNIVKLVDFFLEPKEDFNVVYIVFELMQTDLRKIIQSKNVLEKVHHQFITYQLLCGLKYMHSAAIWHRDLKPANLLLNANSELKICDFGLSRGVDENSAVTDYVVTRWYRAPEVMVCDSYDEKIDVWAVGCILAELHGHQVSEYLKVLGAPKPEDLSFITNEHAKKFVEKYGNSLKSENLLPQMYADIDKDALDLMMKMLQFNPHKRISVDEALDHPFYRGGIRKPAHEIVCEEKFDFSFEKKLRDVDGCSTGLLN
eukprot:jgi/Bigna1/92219/estExt_fgenesh1_pm.C_80003